MSLSKDLSSLFAKSVKEEPKSNSNSILYGTVVEYDGAKYVKIDGSELLTPVTSTTDTKEGERVTVSIQNHTAIVTGNLTSPAARTDDVKELGSKVSEFEIVVADKVNTEQLEAQIGRIDTLVSDNVTIKETLTANSADISELEADNVTINEKLEANDAAIKKLDAEKITADQADLKYATIANLEATNADIYNLNATYGEFSQLTTEKLEANDAAIKNLETNKLDANQLSAEVAKLGYATVESLEAESAKIDELEADVASFETATAERFTANEASINDLEANKLSATDIEGKYANIDFSNISKATMEWFYANSGLIENVTVGDAAITGNLVGVTIKGDLIEGGTVVAEKLVIKGTDGLYYKLNTDGVTTEAEQTEYNSLNGSIITANSITATKINVDDLVAFDATIGGFKITENSIYSGVKESVDNTTRGIYLDNDGQVSFGDADQYVKFYKDSDGVYKLAIAADGIFIGDGRKSVEESITGVIDAVNNIEIGGNNLIRYAHKLSGEGWSNLTGSTKSYEVMSDGVTKAIFNVSGSTSRPYTQINYTHGSETNRTVFVGDKYVASIYYYCPSDQLVPDDNVILLVRFIDENGSNLASESVIIKPEDLVFDKWTRISVSIEATEEAARFIRYIPHLVNNGYVEFAYPQLEKGTIVTDWNVAPEDNDVNSLELGGVNLFVKSTVTSGYYLDSTGASIDNSLWGISDYIDVTNMSKYIASGYTNLGANPSTCYYDADKNYISGKNYRSADAKVPDGASYMRFSYLEADKETLKIEKGTKATSYSPAPEDMATKVEMHSAIEQTAESITLSVDKKLENYSTTTEMNSAIKQTSDNIKLEVSETYTTKTDFNDAFDIHSTATGSPVVVSDSAESPLEGLVVYGNSIQNGTPTPDAPVEIVSVGDKRDTLVTVFNENLLYADQVTHTTKGITFTNNGDGTFTVTGTKTSSGNVEIRMYSTATQIYVTKGTYYTLKTDILDGAITGAGIYVHFIDMDGNVTYNVLINGSSATTRTYKASKNGRLTSFAFVVSGTNEINMTFRTQLVASKTAPEWTMAATPQLLPLATSGNGLRGIPVDSGGNYTDENGQMWIADELDFERGVKIQRTHKFDVTDDFTVADYTALGTYARVQVTGIDSYEAVSQTTMTPAFCNVLPWQISITSDTAHFYVNAKNIWVFVPIAELSTQDNAGAKEWLINHSAEFLYVLATPVETPLTDEEIEAYKALKTNYPTTTILVNDGADMVLDYRRYTKAVDFVTPTEMKSSIDQTAESITLSVSNTYTTKEEFNDLEIGGKNLLRNSNFSNGTNYWENTGLSTYEVITDSTKGTYLHISSTNAGSIDYRLFHATKYLYHSAGTTYSLSFDAKSSTEGTILESNIGASSSQNGTTYALTTSWKRYTCTYTATADGSLTFWLQAANTDAYITNIKLELGDKPTDWTLAPEDYSTTVEMNSAIELKADSITSTVQQKIDDLEFGGRNYILGSSGGWSDWITPEANENNVCYTPLYANLEDETIEVGDPFIGSVEIEFSGVAAGTGGSFRFMTQGSLGFITDGAVTTTWDKGQLWNGVTITTPPEDGVYRFEMPHIITEDQAGVVLTYCGFRCDYWDGAGKYRVRRMKFERGTKATSWTPAQEETATAEDVLNAHAAAIEAGTAATQAQSDIIQLADQIEMLIVDENGYSLMTQTSDGFTFNIGEYTASMSELTDYVRITTDADAPCIELGETDSPFKVLITNEKIDFLQDSNAIAYINNQQMNIDKAVIDNELQVGGFVLKTHGQGNVGFIWKGES